ncbi:LysM peptidoglycan-binding domain-containing protein [Lactiplantibacillus plantarum]|nr:LysM peptidoglycan-binding domain-containing protein [Lactiplantibacillus plantarum]
MYEKSCNFNTHYCETTLLTVSRWHSKTRASHTYYTVVSGDSWWVIAQHNGLSVYTLAAQNGKSICSTIYPGDRLQIN